MQPLSVTVRYRPIRIGWCLRHGDLEGVRYAVRNTFTMWGGVYNPLINIDDADMAARLIEVFRVDVLLPATDDPAVTAFIDSRKDLPNPLYDTAPFIGSKGDRSPHYIDIMHPVRKLYREHVKNNPTPTITTRICTWDATDPLADVYMMEYGEFPSTDDTGTHYLDAIRNRLNGQEAKLSGLDRPVFSQGDVFISQVNTALLDQHYVAGNYWAYPGFFYGSAKNFDDLTMFWNLRATNALLHFYDSEHDGRLRSFTEHTAAWVREQKKDKAVGMRTVAVWYHGEQPADLSVFGAPLMVVGLTPGHWNGLNIGAPYMYISEASALASVGASYSGRPQIAIQLPSRPVENERVFGQHLIASVSPGIGLYDDDDFTLHTLYLPDLNEFYGRELHGRWSEARAEPEGIGIIVSAATTSTTLTALEVSQLISRVFATVGISAAPSRAGRIAKQLIRQMGKLQGCRAFKIVGVRDLIESLKPEDTTSKSNATRIIGGHGTDRSIEPYKDLFIEPRDYRTSLAQDAVWTYLLKREVFRAGLKHECPNCTLDFWVPLDDTRSEATCEYCGHRFKIAPYLKDRDWAFRRSGLFGRGDNQEGAIPVVMTLMQFDTMQSSREFLYTTGTLLKPVTADIEDCETDFIGIVQRPRDQRIQIIIGECKTRKAIDENDIRKLRKVADAFPAARYDVYIVFAKLEEFGDAELDLAKALNTDKHGKRVILLTARELEPYDFYERTATEFDIDRVAVSFEDMAEATDVVFFERRRKKLG